MVRGAALLLRDADQVLVVEQQLRHELEADVVEVARPAVAVLEPALHDAQVVREGEVGRELDAVGVVVAGIVMLGNVLIDEVAGNVVEPVDFDVQPGEPLAASEGELEGMERFGLQNIAVLIVGAQIVGHDEVGLTIQVGRVDERLGVAELQVPFRLHVYKCQTGRELADLGVVETVLVVEAQAGIEDEGAPVVLQLGVGVDVALVTFTHLRDGVGLRDT